MTLNMHTLVYTCTECGTETRELARDVGVPEFHIRSKVSRHCLSPDEARLTDREEGCGKETEMIFEGMVATGPEELDVSRAECPLCLGECSYEGERLDRESQDIALPPRDEYEEIGYTLWAALEKARFSS